MLYLNNNLFNKFPPAEINMETWNMLIGGRQSQYYKKKTRLPIEHQQIDKLLCIISGRVKTLNIFFNGSEKVFELLEAPAIIGYQALFSARAEAQYPHIVMLEDTELVYIPINEAEAVIYANPDLLRAIFISIKNILTISRIQSGWNQNLNLAQRTALALSLTKYSAKDKDGFFQITHEDIAGFVGISRTNVTAALSKLYGLGLIDKNFGKIKVLDMDKLEAFIHSNEIA